MDSRHHEYTVPNLPATETLIGIRIGQADDIKVSHTNLENAKRSKEELAEIFAALKDWRVQDIVTYPLERLAYFELIATIETELQIHEEFDIYQLTRTLHQKMLPDLTRHFASNKEAYLEEFASEVAEKLIANIVGIDKPNWSTQRSHDVFLQSRIRDHYFDVACQIYFKIKHNFLSGTYSPTKAFLAKYNVPFSESHEVVAVLAKMVLQDQLYREASHASLSGLIKALFSRHIDEYVAKGELFERYDMEGNSIGSAPLQRLSQHAGSARCTYMLAGPPACGKGTLMRLLMQDVKEKHGIESYDMVKINTDAHRLLVSEGHEHLMGDDKRYHVSLNNDEASYITKIAYEKMLRKVQAGSAPHLLIDGVNPSPDRIEVGIANGGQMQIWGVSIPAAESVQRAYARGQQTGRFVQSGFLMRSHKVFSEEVFTGLLTKQHYIGKPITVFLFDNMVPRGSDPIKIAAFDMQAGMATIFDEDKLAEFRGKRHMEAALVETLFSSSMKRERRKSFGSVSILLEAGYQVEKAAADEQQVDVDNTVKPSGTIRAV